MGAAIWSQSVRGTVWSWTARETWLLVYVLLLAAYLNLHFSAGWRERRAAWFLLVASLAGLVSFGAQRSFPAPGGDASMQPSHSSAESVQRPKSRDRKATNTDK
jgi:hypothetical protein